MTLAPQCILRGLFFVRTLGSGTVPLYYAKIRVNPMPDPTIPQSEQNESFEQLLADYERGLSRKTESGEKQLEGTVIAINADSVILDIGYKSEGILPLADFQVAGEA